MSPISELVRRAVQSLPLIPDAPVDFAIARIVWMLDQRRLAKSVRPPTAAQGADELRDFASAARELLETAARLSKPAIEALNEAKFRRDVTWPPAHSKWSFMRSDELHSFLDAHYPALIEAAEEAASELSKQKKAGRPPGRDQYLSALACMVAGFFEALTGREPTRGRGGASDYSKFMGAIFDAIDLGSSVEHFADVGADLHLRSKGANPPEISWVSRPDDA